MSVQVRKHIGVMPPHQTKHRRFIEDFQGAVTSSARIIPRTRFYNISFERLLYLSEKGFAYDVVICSRMKDHSDPRRNNIITAAYELRNRLGLDTVFVVSFNALLAEVRGLDPKVEERYISILVEHGQDPQKSGIHGIIYTTSTDPTFLVSIVADVLDNPGTYLAIEQVHRIETQAHFLNHPPGHTQYGIGQ